jgi:signal transduction histidine kinase/HAMP domain-containing protein
MEIRMKMRAFSINWPHLFTSLRAQLIALILMAVIPTFGVILYSANQHRELTAGQAQRNALSAARAIAAEQERFLENAHQFLVMLARVPQIRNTSKKACSKFFAGLLEPIYADLGIADREGNLLCSALPAGKSLVVAKGPHYTRAVESHEYSVGTIRIEPSTGKTLADLAFPLTESPGDAARGVVVAALDLSWVTKITAQNHLYAGATFTLVDSFGTVLLRYPGSPGWEGKPIFKVVPTKGMESQDVENAVKSAGADGIDRVFAFSRLKSPIGGQAAYAAVDIPAKLAFADANRILLHDLIILGLLAGVILSAAWFGTDVFVLRRIHDIVAATKQVAGGRLSARTKMPYRKGELGQMARTFDELAETLEKREAEVHASAKKIHQQRQQQSALHDLNLAITSTLDLASVLRILLEEIAALFPSSGATVEWINRKTGALETIAQHNIGAADGDPDGAPKEMSLPSAVLARQAPVAISDTHTDPRTGSPEFFRLHNFRSYLGVPMIAKEETLGVLSIYMRDQRGFSSEEELEFLTALVNQAAMAIYNSQLFEQTRNQAAELERSNKIKDEFLGVMSHELRTPLNIIMNYSEALQMGTFGQITAEQEKGTNKIRSQAGHLLSLINGILEITKIESGTVALLKEPIDLVEFMADNRTDYVMPMEKELTLEWHYPAHLPTIESDRVKLRQILTNLINNAIKFTDQGSVTIIADLLDEGRTFEFQVRDTGPGIPAEALPFVFDKFRQIDSTTTRHYSGAGLGLYIVKSFVEILGGTVSVQSTLGTGSQFTVRLPVNAAGIACHSASRPAASMEEFLN